MAKKTKNATIVECCFTEESKKYGIVYQDHEYATLDMNSLDNVLDEIAGFKQKFGAKYRNLTFREIKDCYCPCDCNCSPKYYVYGERDMTAEEIAEEENKKQKHEKDQMERDRAQYEMLRAKLFGDK